MPYGRQVRTYRRIGDRERRRQESHWGLTLVANIVDEALGIAKVRLLVVVHGIVVTLRSLFVLCRFLCLRLLRHLGNLWSTRATYVTDQRRDVRQRPAGSNARRIPLSEL